MSRIGSYMVLLLLGAVVLLSLRVRHLQQEKTRLEDNQKMLLSDVQYYKTSDSLNAAGVNRLVLTNKEFKKYNADLKKTVENLKLKVRRLQSVSQTAISSVYPIRTTLCDSILPDKIDTIQCVSYHDNYVTLSGCIENKEFSGLIQSRDTLIQIVHRVPRKFWFIRWGTKAIRQEVISKNPYSKITYTKYIELRKWK